LVVTKIYTVLAAFIALAVLELAVLVATELRRTEAEGQVRRTAAILREHAVMGREFEAMRSAQNAFFLTGRPELLSKYEQHRVRYGAAMRMVRELVLDPEQTKRLNQTDRFVDDWHRGATIPILQSRQRGGAVGPLVAEEALPRAERIESILEAFERIEGQMLVEREAARDRVLDTGRVVRAVVPLLDIALAVALLIAIRRSRRSQPPGRAAPS